MVVGEGEQRLPELLDVREEQAVLQPLVGARRIIIKLKNKKNSKLVNWLDTIIMASYVRFRLFLFGMWFFYAWTDNSCLQHSDPRTTRRSRATRRSL